jgi:hypothetical protein
VTWFDHQSRSKKLAAAARVSTRRGDDAAARDLFAQAAGEAEQALRRCLLRSVSHSARSRCSLPRCGAERTDRMTPLVSHGLFEVRPNCSR